MDCPNCHQAIPQLPPDGCCPLCGHKVGVARRQVTTLYVITGAITASVFVYGALVFILESTGYQRPEPQPLLCYGCLALSIALFAPMFILERKMLAKETVQGVRSATVMVGALAESMALYGLVLYFIGGGIKWFVILLGVSLVGFMYLATRIPTYARLLEKYTIEGRES